MLHEAAYGEGSPLGSSTFALNMNTLSAEDVMSYRAHTYNGNNVTGTDCSITNYPYPYPTFTFCCDCDL